MPTRPKKTRRPQRNARDSHAAILQAAALEFSERGFDAARVDRIATRARLNKAMIYYHFGSKDGLYLAVLRGVFSPAGERARRSEERRVGKEDIAPLLQEHKTIKKSK